MEKEQNLNRNEAEKDLSHHSKEQLEKVLLSEEFHWYDIFFLEAYNLKYIRAFVANTKLSDVCKTSHGKPSPIPLGIKYG